MRLDRYLMIMGYASSRNAANKLIKNKTVKVDDVIITKSNFVVTDPKIEILQPLQYVSRGGDKLAHALDIFNLDVKNLTIIDLGASTGGFTDVCIQQDARKVFCVDVGRDQLALRLCKDPRVINLENTNVKNLNQILIPDEIDLVVSDLSFISSHHMFKTLHQLKLKSNVQIISLIKPQFELTPELFKKHHGVIKDPKLHSVAIQRVSNYANDNGFKVLGIIESPILGAKKHNKEFLIWCERG